MTARQPDSTTTTYEIRDAFGELQALHDRWDGPRGKRLAWRLAGRTDYGLDGRRVESLPLYGFERVAPWPVDAWIVVTEGESDCEALTKLDVPALGTVTGALTAPATETLADVSRGRRFVLWPDNDGPGRQHMVLVGANLYRAGAAAVRTLAYRPLTGDWPKGAGARDLVGNLDPASGAYMVAWLLEEWSVPVDRPGPFITVRPSRNTVSAPRRFGSVSDALIARGVLNARPGHTVRCPLHEDRHASLSILRDDQRAICKSASCEWSGRGVIAADVLEAVRA